MNNLIVRKADINDIPSIYSMVIDLAVFENEPNAVTATLKEYQEDFVTNCFEALVTEVDNQIVGIMIYYMTYSTWKGKMLYLEDFIVAQNFRSKGIGEKMFEELLLVAREKKARLVKWAVLDWNEGAIRFYKRIGATIDSDWLSGKIYLKNT